LPSALEWEIEPRWPLTNYFLYLGSFFLLLTKGRSGAKNVFFYPFGNPEYVEPLIQDILANPPTPLCALNDILLQLSFCCFTMCESYSLLQRHQYKQVRRLLMNFQHLLPALP
jgi:hypothetical protein